MGKRCITVGKIIPRSAISDTTNIHRSTVENVRKNDVFHAFCDATRPTFIALQIEEREVNLRIVLHLFCIHYFLVRRIFKFLYATVCLDICRSFRHVWTWGMSYRRLSGNSGCMVIGGVPRAICNGETKPMTAFQDVQVERRGYFIKKKNDEILLRESRCWFKT